MTDTWNRDLLVTIYDWQHKMQVDTFKTNFERMTNEEVIEYIRWNTIALEDELHEALGEIGWKPWAESRHINREAYIGELIDALHFLLNLFIVVDAGPVEIFERYAEKRARNITRQLEGYDGVSGKCQNCHRAMDDVVAHGEQPYSAWFCCKGCAATFAATH